MEKIVFEIPVENGKVVWDKFKEQGFQVDKLPITLSDFKELQVIESIRLIRMETNPICWFVEQDGRYVKK